MLVVTLLLFSLDKPYTATLSHTWRHRMSRSTDCQGNGWCCQWAEVLEAAQTCNK